MLTFVANGNHVDLVTCAGGGVIDLRSLNGANSAVGEAAAIPDPATLEREVRITLGRLPDFVRREIGATRFLGTPASTAALREAAEPPLRVLGIHQFHGGDGANRDEVPDVAGLAADHHLHGTPATFEFLPPRVEQWQLLFKRLSSRRNRILTMAVPALLGVAALFLLGRGHWEHRLEQRWAAISPDVSELEDIQENIRQFRPWFDNAPQSVNILSDLARAFPETGEVWARQIEIKEDQMVSVSGLARDRAALMAVLDGLRVQPLVTEVQVRQVRGENPVQFSFSFIWTRGRRD
jgi:Tfp pilus assembly protein PilN